MNELFAILHSADRGQRWHVEFDGDFIVVASKDATCDAARALFARGHTGKCTMLDAETGMARFCFDIDKLAGLKTEEGPHGPRFVKIRKETVVDRPRTAETPVGYTRPRTDKDSVVATTTGEI